MMTFRFGKRAAARSVLVAAACAALVATGTGPAEAATRQGWIGPTLPSNGTVFLHYSTVSNTPLYAETRVYSQLGTVVPAHDIGVQSRLFKSGVMCRINDYKYNSAPTNSFTDRTSGDCGTGSYNSHGFVSVWNGSTYVTYPTFPTDPLNFTAPAARSSSNAPADVRAESGRNARGQTYGSGVDNENVPDLIASIGTNGQVGYVKKSDLPTPASNRDAATNRSPRQVQLYDKDGVTVKGTFRIN